MADENVITLKLTDIIGNVPSWSFPLDKKRLDHLLNIDYLKEDTKSFKSVFWYTIQKMRENGVHFFSPGGSHGRQFIYWFNSHFWTEDLNAPKFEKEDLLFKQVFMILKKHSGYTLTNNLPNQIIGCDKVIIDEGNKLSDIGKEFILSLSPFVGNSKNISFGKVKEH